MKTVFLNLKQQVMNHPDIASFLAFFASILTFIIKTWQIDIFLVFGLFALIIVDTITGVRRAKKYGLFDYRKLKEKTVAKVLGYILFIFAFSVFTIMLFIVNQKDGAPFIDNYFLNIPLMTTILFFCGIEFLSVNDNLKTAYGIRTPGSVTDQVSKFVDKQENPKNNVQ